MQLGKQNTEEQTYRSPVIPNSLSPKWADETFTWEGADVDDMLTIRLADKTPVGKRVIGSVIIPVRELSCTPGEPIRKEWPCTSEKGHAAGSVDLTFEFTGDS